jgi:hypothetical protein
MRKMQFFALAGRWGGFAEFGVWGLEFGVWVWAARREVRATLPMLAPRL